MPIELHVPAATADQLACGVSAAARVFRDAGTAAEIAVFGREARDRWEARGRIGDPPSAIHLALAATYDLAEAAAIEACCGDSRRADCRLDVVGPEGVALYVPGASAVQLARGVEAALAVFRRHRIAPQGAAIGEFERRVWDDRGFGEPEPSAESFRAAAVFDEAEHAAFEACGVEGWDRYLQVTGIDGPYWQACLRQSPVLNDVPSCGAAVDTLSEGDRKNEASA